MSLSHFERAHPLTNALSRLTYRKSKPQNCDVDKITALVY